MRTGLIALMLGVCCATMAQTTTTTTTTTGTTGTTGTTTTTGTTGTSRVTHNSATSTSNDYIGSTWDLREVPNDSITHTWARPENTKDGIQFIDTMLNAALEMARDSNRLVFVDCYTKTCVPCKYMATYIFPQKTCGDYFNPRFISLKKDIEEGDGPQIAEHYEVQLYPTYLVIRPDGSLMAKYVGAIKDPDRFCMQIHDLMLLTQMNETFEQGYRDDEFLQQYLVFIKSLEPSRLSAVVDTAMAAWPVDKLCEPDNWRWVTDGVISPESPVFRRLFTQRSEFAAILGEEEFAQALMRVYSEEYRVYRYIGFDFAARIADLEQLEKEPIYKGALPLRLRMQEMLQRSQRQRKENKE